MKLLAIDPGLKACGWALYENNFLHKCGIILGEKNNPIKAILKIYDTILDIEICPNYLVVEKPHIAISREVDPNDILDITLMAGACLTLDSFDPEKVWVPTPQEWKGSTPKLICHHRMFKKLTETEKFIIQECLKNVPRSLHHNAYDAAALGLKYLERLGFRND